MADIAKNMLVEAPAVGNSRQPDPVVSADVRARIAQSVAESNRRQSDAYARTVIGDFEVRILAP